MKIRYGSLSRRITESFNLTLNIIFAYRYEYSGRIYFFRVNIKYNLINGVHVQVVCIACIFYYKLYLGSRMCKVMVIKSDGPIMIGKLQLVLKTCKYNALTYIC